MIAISEKKKIDYLRALIREEIGRSYSSSKTLPMDFQHYPEIDVIVDFWASDREWIAEIKPKKKYKEFVSKPDYVFKKFASQEDANSFARGIADKMRRDIMEKNKEFPSKNTGNVLIK